MSTKLANTIHFQWGGVFPHADSALRSPAMTRHVMERAGALLRTQAEAQLPQKITVFTFL